MKMVLLLYSLMFVVISSAPTQNQDADAAWLSNKIYEGVNTMNTDSGCVIKSHLKKMELMLFGSIIVLKNAMLLSEELKILWIF